MHCFIWPIFAILRNIFCIISQYFAIYSEIFQKKYCIYRNLSKDCGSFERFHVDRNSFERFRYAISFKRFRIFILLMFETPEITNLIESVVKDYLANFYQVFQELIAVIAIFKLGRQSNSMNPMDPAYNHCLKTMVICRIYRIYRIHRIRSKMYLLK